MSLILGTLLFCTAIQRAAIYVSVIPAVIAFSFYNIKWRNLELGNKVIWIPVIVIVLIALVNGTTWQNKLFMVLMVLVYLAGASSKDSVFRYMNLLILVSVFSIIITFGLSGWLRTGGLFSEGNYNIAVGVIALCTIVSKKFWIYPIAIIGLIFTGAGEGILAICVLLFVLIVNREWKILMCSLGLITVLVSIALSVGVIYKTDYTIGFNSRVETWKEAVNSISLFGHGFQPFELNGKDIHNTPLIVLHQIGIVGMLSWLWIVGYGIVKNRAKRIWLMVGVLSIFDNFIWGQLGMWFWYFTGAYQKESEVI